MLAAKVAVETELMRQPLTSEGESAAQSYPLVSFAVPWSLFSFRSLNLNVSWRADKNEHLIHNGTILFLWPQPCSPEWDVAGNCWGWIWGCISVAVPLTDQPALHSFAGTLSHCFWGSIILLLCQQLHRHIFHITQASASGHLDVTESVKPKLN